MLTNPGLEPSASINCWIIAILTFHFILVHVSSTLYSPNGLSCQPLQPGNYSKPNNNLDNWINNLYSFMHQINNPYPLPPDCQHLTILANTISEGNNTINLSLTYSNIPHIQRAILANEQILAVKKWHSDLVHPSNLLDTEYTTFLLYYTVFFLT